MSFAFPLLLGGLSLAGIPVLLHLIVRQKPRTLPFPAFRFLVQKQKTNLRKLRLRHLLLLALRVLLIAAMCLAMARPRLFHERLNLSNERPTAAILIFDTSASMEYRSGATTRLEEAKQRGLELLDRLPAGSRLLILDSADVLQERAAPPWLRSLDEARKRITALKVRAANAPVTRSLDRALRRVDELARAGDDVEGQKQPRLICVFTDRTRGCWEDEQLSALVDLADRVPPLFEGLQQVRSHLAPLAELLASLRDRLDAGSGQYSDASLREGLLSLEAELRRVTPADLPPDEALGGAVRKVRRFSRELLRQTRPSAGGADAVQEYRTKLRGLLALVLRDLAGAQLLFIDVGVAQPVDLALLGLELPRDQRGSMQQSFGAGDRFVVQASVQATGKDVENTLTCTLDGKKLPPRSFKLGAGQKETIALFDSSALGEVKEAPFHQVEARFETAADALPGNNQAYLTFAIRPRQRILVLGDDIKHTELPARALEALGYEAVVQAIRPRELPKLSGIDAALLVGIESPAPELWQALANFVQQGHGLAIAPGGDEMVAAAYNDGPARLVMPAAIESKVSAAEPGSAWDWSAGQYRHPFLQPFAAWKDDPKTDFILYPRTALHYWEVKPDKSSSVLIRYQDGKHLPALVVRTDQGGGKVLLFTTPLDQREPAWNNYDAKITSFYLALLWQSSRYLCGIQETPLLNFRLGLDTPAVSIPPAARNQRYRLTGAELLDKLPRPDKGVLTLGHLAGAGNFAVEEREERKGLAGFSVNLPAEESDLRRVPDADLEQLAGEGSIIMPGRSVELRQALGERWSEPVDVFPWLMVLLLVVLAVENLLANRFYRQPVGEN